MNVMKWLSTVCLLFLLACSSPTAPAYGQEVTRVVDGDTLVVATIGTVRLIGVDTPETVDRRKPKQPYGAEASAFLKALTLGQAVRLEFDHERTDRYKRTLAYVYLADGTFVNEEIIRQGYGFAYTEFPFKLMQEFRALERTARAEQKGMWAPGDTLQPMVYVNAGSEVYHLQACRYVTPDSRPVALAVISKGHRPCGICKPPKQ